MVYRPGDNWIICDISGRRCLMSQSKKTWDGLRVHPDYWYPRHPQLDVKGRPDRPGVVDGRPEGPERFILNCGWFVMPWFLEPGWFGDCDSDLYCAERWAGDTWSMRPDLIEAVDDVEIQVLPPVSPDDL